VVDTRRFVFLLWLLSIAPIAVALAIMPQQLFVACLSLFIALDMAHALSPIVLAWCHNGFRQVMIAQPRKYIVLPTVLFLAALGVGIATVVGWTSYVSKVGNYHHATGWSNPYPILFGVYFAWNFYHFAMQNYGVLRLCGVDWGRWGKILAFVVTAIGIKTIPLAVAVNHWVVEIGLASRVIRWKLLFISGILIAGSVAFLWHVLPWQAPEFRDLMLLRMEGAVMIMVAARFGIGFVHFLYSRWVWKISDPQVRATIGHDLFATRRLDLCSVPVTRGIQSRV
jgi:hypothetical protein